jgi:hypothetical protein
MSDRSEQKRLLADMLAESSPPDFRAALLDKTLRHARTRRRWRQARQTGGVLVLAVLTAVLCLQRPPGKSPIVRPAAKIPVPQSFQLVETRSLPAAAIITTVNFAPVNIIASGTGVTEITSTSGHFKFINDQELLALVGNYYPAALVRTGPDSEELVFANPDDRKKIFGN